jgi:predicted deacylase
VKPRIAQRQLDTGSGIGVPAVELAGSSDGPTAAMLAGVHGDEDEGIVAVRRLVHLLAQMDLRGRVVAIPVANPPAFVARSRTSPLDGLNLARVFPGEATGSPTERIARAIADEVIHGADLLIDLHSAGAGFAMPLFCGFHDVGTPSSATARELAIGFGAPLIWAHPLISPGRSLSVAASEGIPALYVEGSGGAQVRGPELDAYTSGVLNVLRHMGNLDEPATDPPAQRIIRGGVGDVDASLTSPADGTLVTWIDAGAPVEEGTLIASFVDAEGELVGEIRSPGHGIVMFLRRDARVRRGDPVVLIAPPPEEI